MQEIDELGAEALQIRIFGKKDLTWLFDFLNYICNITKRLRIIELILTYDIIIDEAGFEKEILKNSLVSSVIVHSSPHNRTNSNSDTPIIYTREFITDASHCGVIKPMYFSCNEGHVLEAYNYNTCLNKKISIDVFGNIKNCPSMIDSFGCIDNTFLSQVINNTVFQKKWHISKKDINVCKDCEFKLICSDCRAYAENEYDKPFKCNYNPYTATWEN